MSEARDEILGRIRRALDDAPPRAGSGEVPRDYARSRPQADLVGHFVERVADYKAEVVRIGVSGLAGAVAEACARYDIATLVTPSGLPTEWVGALDGVAVVVDGEPVWLSTADLDSVDGVLTGAAVGIAETGTIVLDAGPRQGRRALSLVPDVLICAIGVDQIVDDVPAAVAILRPQRPLTWISGPSATSDIELDRVEGVHGPRTLHVIVVDTA
jgi:L-lactate dehydrogenase complex protein LldG